MIYLVWLMNVYILKWAMMHTLLTLGQDVMHIRGLHAWSMAFWPRYAIALTPS